MKSGHLTACGLLLATASTFAAGPELVAAGTIPGLTIPRGTKTAVIADFNNQQVTSPTALAFGPKGELYIAETHRLRHGVADNRNHLYWYLDDITSRTTADRRMMHEKWQNQNATTSLKFLSEKEDLVRVLTDPDADGVFRKQKVFAGKFNDVLDGVASGVFEYEGTVYFACVPKLYALRDTDGDGEADVSEVIQNGFGVHVSLSGHDLNGFILGADGRIYGTMGDRGFNGTTREGHTYNLHDEGFVFRFDPDGSNFEIIHTGLRNPKEIAFDELGNLISVDNNCDHGDKARVVHIIDGAYSGWHMGHQGMLGFHKQIGMENKPPAKWMDERVWDLPNSEQPASILPPVDHLTSGPSGMTYHPGTGFLKSEAGRFLICDYRGGAAKSGIWSFKMETSGAGMKMVDYHEFNSGTAATDIEYSWDGKLTVTDFIGGWESHLAGRVYTIAADQPYLAKEAAQTATLVREGFEHRSANNLASLLFHPDMRVRIRAQLALSRKPEGLDMFTKAAAQTKNPLTRLHGVWGLGVIARRGSAALPVSSNSQAAGPALREKARLALLPLLKDQEAEVRAQAIKALGESGLAAEEIPFDQLIADTSPRVRLQATIAARRMKAAPATGPILAMLEKNTDLSLRHTGSHALSVLETPENLAALKSNANTNIRMAAVIALGRVQSPLLAGFLTDSEGTVADEAIRLINDHDIAEIRPLLGALLENTADRPLATMLWRRLLHSAFRAGDETNARRVLKAALDQATPEASRVEAFRLLSEWSNPHPVDQTSGRVSPLPARDPELIRKVLSENITALVQVDGKYLEAALALVQKNQLDLSSVTDEVLRNLIESDQVPGSARVEALNFYITRKTADLDAMIAKLARGNDDHLAIGALRHLAQSSHQAALEALSKTTSSGSAYRQQQAWKLAADLPGAGTLFVSALKELQKQNGISPAALELIDAAAKRSEPEVKAALEAFKAAQAASGDPLAAWLPSLEGGDPENGAKVFESHPAGQCMRCHAGGHGGGDAGPNLADVGLREDRKHMLESLVLPGAKVAMGYGIASATLKGGKTVAGIVIDDKPGHVDFDSAGSVLRVARGDIESMTPPVSAMPPMNFLLSQREIRDVVAWLSEQKTKVRNNKRRPAPVQVTP
jgi:quinoprotein glucose dehydrogenase